MRIPYRLALFEAWTMPVESVALLWLLWALDGLALQTGFIATGFDKRRVKA